MLLQSGKQEIADRLSTWLTNQSNDSGTVDWLWWGETDVSELRPVWAYSSPGNCDVDHGMMVSAGTIS
jgi:hypothetical protein